MPPFAASNLFKQFIISRAAVTGLRPGLLLCFAHAAGDLSPRPIFRPTRLCGLRVENRPELLAALDWDGIGLQWLLDTPPNVMASVSTYADRASDAWHCQ